MRLLIKSEFCNAIMHNDTILKNVDIYVLRAKGLMTHGRFNVRNYDAGILTHGILTQGGI